MNSIYPGSELWTRLVTSHLQELRDDAAEERLARHLRGPRGPRYTLGRLLIAAGEALAGPGAVKTA